jgi:hypothetical protein
MNKELRQYECSIDGQHWSSYNTTSRGKAKAEYLLDLDDCAGPDAYTRIRCRVVGSPHTSEDFKRMAQMRGIDFAYCGMVVKIQNDHGVIVGHCDSLNLKVLMTDGRYKGRVDNCHPTWETTYYDRAGNVIKTFVKS